MRIGNGSSEYADKFENIKEIFESDKVFIKIIYKYTLKKKGVPAKVRRYIYGIIE